MLITMTKPDESGSRKAVLVVEAAEIINAASTIARVYGSEPSERHADSDGNWKYYFPSKLTDKLMLAFPRATKSAGLQRKIDAMAARELEARQVEPFHIPGLYDRKFNQPARLFDYQYTAVSEAYEFLMGEFDTKWVEHFLENDQMGLGKTLMALCVIAMILERNPQAKFLVISPKNGKSVWERENLRWTDLEMVVVDAERQSKPTDRRALIASRPTITVINPEMLRGTWNKRAKKFEARTYPELFTHEYDYVIIDEYHRFGSPTSQQSMGLLALHAKKFMPMSGTPFLNRPEQMWVTLHRCWPDLYPNYYAFERSITVKNEAGFKSGYNPERMYKLRTFMNARSIRRRKDQVLKDLPSTHVVTIPVELTKAQRKLYNQIRDDFLLKLDNGEYKTIANIMVQVGRLKQACFSPELYGGSPESIKLEVVTDDVKEIIESGEKLLLFSEWSTATKILMRELNKYNPLYVDGSTPQKVRPDIEDAFNSDPSRQLYIGTIGANRESISLGAATNVLFTDEDWSPLVNDQAIGRSAAGGLRGLNAGVSSVEVRRYYAIDTYEERILEMLEDKMAIFNAMVDKDGGQKIIKSLGSEIRTSIKDLL